MIELRDHIGWPTRSSVSFPVCFSLEVPSQELLKGESNYRLKNSSIPRSETIDKYVSKIRSPKTIYYILHYSGTAGETCRFNSGNTRQDETSHQIHFDKGVEISKHSTCDENRPNCIDGVVLLRYGSN